MSAACDAFRTSGSCGKGIRVATLDVAAGGVSEGIGGVGSTPDGDVAAAIETEAEDTRGAVVTAGAAPVIPKVASSGGKVARDRVSSGFGGGGLVASRLTASGDPAEGVAFGPDTSRGGFGGGEVANLRPVGSPADFASGRKLVNATSLDGEALAEAVFDGFASAVAEVRESWAIAEAGRGVNSRVG